MSIDERIHQVFSDVLSHSGSAGDDASPATVPTWDSLRHMTLIVALEDEFGIGFDDADLDDLVTLGGIRRVVGRLASRAAA